MEWFKFRIFVQDVGARGYSGFTDVDAASAEDALRDVKQWPPIIRGGLPRYIALQHMRRDLWPDGQTGIVPPDALTIGVGAN